jgi:hypothetical protein
MFFCVGLRGLLVSLSMFFCVSVLRDLLFRSLIHALVRPFINLQSNAKQEQDTSDTNSVRHLKGLLVIRVGKRDCAVADSHDGQNECGIARALVEIFPNSTQGRLGRIGVEMRSDNRIQRLEKPERHGRHTKYTMLVGVVSLVHKDVKVLDGDSLCIERKREENSES